MNKEVVMPTICRGVNGKGELVFVVKKGSIGVQLNHDEAMYTIRMLGLFCKIGVAFAGLDVKMHRMNANENSTKDKPLGGDDKEEHL